MCWPGVEGADGHGDKTETIMSSEVTRSSGDGVLRKDKQCSHVSNSNMQTECVNARKHYVFKAFCSKMELWPMKSLDDTHTHCCSNYTHLHVFLTSTATIVIRGEQHNTAGEVTDEGKRYKRKLPTEKRGQHSCPIYIYIDIFFIFFPPKKYIYIYIFFFFPKWFVVREHQARLLPCICKYSQFFW